MIDAEKRAQKAALTAQGIDLAGVPFVRYHEKIAGLSGGKSPAWENFEPDPLWDWLDIRRVAAEDVQEPYQYKVIELLTDSDVSTSFTGANAYKTSDGAFYAAASATHTWDTA